MERSPFGFCKLQQCLVFSHGIAARAQREESAVQLPHRLNNQYPLLRVLSLLLFCHFAILCGAKGAIFSSGNQPCPPPVAVIHSGYSFMSDVRKILGFYFYPCHQCPAHPTSSFVTFHCGRPMSMSLRGKAASRVAFLLFAEFDIIRTLNFYMKSQLGECKSFAGLSKGSKAQLKPGHESDQCEGAAAAKTHSSLYTRAQWSGPPSSSSSQSYCKFAIALLPHSNANLVGRARKEGKKEGRKERRPFLATPA